MTAMKILKNYSFEKLDAWKESRELLKIIYLISAKFPTEEKFGLVSQIRRAAVSIPSNIAEGSGRISKPDQRNFYKNAYSSLMEVLCQLLLSYDLEFIDKEELNKIRFQIDHVSRLLVGLYKSTE